MHIPSTLSLPIRLALAAVAVGLAGIGWAHEDDEQNAGQAVTLSIAEQAVADRLAAYAEAFVSGDLQRIEGFFLADERLSSFEGSYADWGWASYRKHLAEELPLFSETRYRVTDVRPQVDGELAFATFAWSLDVTVVSDQFEGGKHPVSMNGIATVVLVRDGKQWKIRHIHTARAQASQGSSTHSDSS